MQNPTHAPSGPAVPAKVYRTPLRVMVAIPMPGLEPEDIEVEITATNTLHVMGRRHAELKGIKDQLLDEWTVGAYQRELGLPAPVDGALANVTYGNGVLVVVLPITDQVRPARLQLNVLSSTRGAHAGHMGKPIRPYARI